VLTDNNQITDGHTGAASQWRFSICARDRATCFTYATTITGASQNLTAALKAAAAPLPAGLFTIGIGFLNVANAWTGNETPSRTETYSNGITTNSITTNSLTDSGLTPGNCVQ